MRIDLKTSSLSNRQSAEARALETIEEMARTNDSTVLLILGESIATVSWLDGFLSTVLQAQNIAARVAVVTSLDDTREHIDMTLRRRNLAVLSSLDEEGLSAGNVTILGAVTEANAEAFAVIRDAGESLVADVATTLGTTIEAAQLRLNALVEHQLIERTKVGRAFVYQLARIEIRRLEIV